MRDDRQFWIAYRAALIQQYRLAALASSLPAGFADGLLHLIAAIDHHAGLRPYDPTEPTARQRHGARH